MSTDLESSLRRHVVTLAERICERYVWRPAALHAAADCLRDELAALGYAVRPQGCGSRPASGPSPNKAQSPASMRGSAVLLGVYGQNSPVAPATMTSSIDWLTRIAISTTSGGRRSLLMSMSRLSIISQKLPSLSSTSAMRHGM